MAKQQEPERKIFVTISDGNKRERFEAWRYWEIVGSLQWMGADRQMAYDAAKWLQQLHPGDSQTLPNGITMEVTADA